MTAQTEVVAIVHIAGPTEIVFRTSKGVATPRSVQRCLRCDALVSVSGSSVKGAFWKVGTRIAIIEIEGRQRLYVVEDRLLAETEHNCEYE